MRASTLARSPHVLRLVEVERSRSRRAKRLGALLVCVCSVGIALRTRLGLALVVLSWAAIQAVRTYRRRALRRGVSRADDDVIRRSGVYRVRD